jgi:hypothetical protein
MDLGKVYFFTATIRNWYPLLEKKEFKDILIIAHVSVFTHVFISSKFML